MKKYNYGSIILILIANGIIVGILQNIFDGNLSILGGFVTFISDYIICRGLLYKREGSFSEYFMGIKTMTGKVFLMNILVGVITVILLMFALLISGAGFLFTPFAINNTRVLIVAIVLIVLITILLSLLFAYVNFFMADERYRDLPFFDTFMLIIRTGLKLFKESFMAGVRAYKISLLTGAIALVTGILSLKSPAALIFTFLFGGIAAIAFFLCTPGFRASLADIYIENNEKFYSDTVEEDL